MAIPMSMGPTQPVSSKYSSSLPIYMPKRVGDKGHPCLTQILHLISSDQPSVVLSLAITFSYNLVRTTLNLRGTIISSSLFHNSVLRMLLQSILKILNIYQKYSRQESLIHINSRSTKR